MNVTMKDIANELGVSIGTVSKVLREHPDISPATRERIQQRMRELNYRPNLAARALVTGRTHTIGLVVPDLVHPFFGEVAKGLSGVLHRKGYSLIISSSEQEREREMRVIELLLARRVDALIVASSQHDSEMFGFAESQKPPVILIDRQPAKFAANFVGVDDEAVGRIATQHLIDRGCRYVAHIGGVAISTALGRTNGYKQALKRSGVPFDARYLISRQLIDVASEETGYEAMKELMALHPRPDGVFCYNDPTATGAMEAILEAGLLIPEDVALVGAGNVRYAKFLRVPLTTVDQQSEEIGSSAAKLALKLIPAKATTAYKTLLLEPQLVVRASSVRD